MNSSQIHDDLGLGSIFVLGVFNPDYENIILKH